MRISYDPVSGIAGLYGAADERAEFVNLADVTIGSVPNALSKELLPDLPETPWTEDLWRFGFNTYPRGSGIRTCVL